jgi:hypothetical protein
VGRIEYLLDQIGLEQDRVGMFNMSAAMAEEFARQATAMTDRIQELGPSPLRASQPENQPQETVSAATTEAQAARSEHR